MGKIKFYFIWILFAATGAGCFDSPKITTSSSVDGLSGKKIFQKYCVSCHGVQGDLGFNGAINLKDSKLSLDEKILVIANGRNTMTPFGKILSPEEIKAVATYTEQFKIK